MRPPPLLVFIWPCFWLRSVSLGLAPSSLKRSRLREEKGPGDHVFIGVNPSTTPLGRCAQRIPGKAGSCTLLSDKICGPEAIPVSELEESRGGHCLASRGTCAVVGSSANLLSLWQGDNIDNHDAVIRMNAAPAGIGDYSQLSAHVGTKVDIRFVNQYGEMPTDEPASSCLFLHEPDMNCSATSSCWWSPELCSKPCDLACRGHGQVHGEAVDWGEHAVIMDNIHADIAKGIVGKYRTSGFVAFAYALMTCETVNVFGFGPPCDGRYKELTDHGSKTCAASELPDPSRKTLAACQQACDEDDACRYLTWYEGSGCRTFAKCETPVDDDPAVKKHIYARVVGDRYYGGGKPVYVDHSYMSELKLIEKAAAEGPETIFPSSRLGDLKAKTVTLIKPECS